MGELEKFALQIGEDKIIERLLENTQVLPCAFGGGIV